MTTYFLLATVGDRFASAMNCLASLQRRYSDWPVVVVAQACTEFQIRMLRAFTFGRGTLLTLEERVGPHNAKLAGLRWMRAREPYVVCSIDDDMELTEATHFAPCVQKCQEPGVGLVSAGWVPNEAQLANRPLKLQWVSQAIVYTGGGLFFSAASARLIESIPEGAYFCDNSEWSLKLYLAGYENFRFRGSLTIHRVQGKGGRRSWVEASGDQRQLPDPRYLPLKRGAASVKGPNNFLVGASEDLTLLAHQRHHAARAAMGL